MKKIMFNRTARFHLVELEDQPWFPAVIRDGGTDFLGFVFNTFNLYQPAGSMIEDVLNKTGYNEVLDLCSGNGGPLESVSKLINETRVELLNVTPVKFILSDKFPNVEAYKSIKQRTKSRITYIEESVDILKNNNHRKVYEQCFRQFTFSSQTVKCSLILLKAECPWLLTVIKLAMVLIILI
jgi:hypothetical protein